METHKCDHMQRQQCELSLQLKVPCTTLREVKIDHLFCIEVTDIL